MENKTKNKILLSATYRFLMVLIKKAAAISTFLMDKSDYNSKYLQHL